MALTDPGGCRSRHHCLVFDKYSILYTLSYQKFMNQDIYGGKAQIITEGIE